MLDYLSSGYVTGSRFAPATPTRTHSGRSGAELGRKPGESLEFIDFRDYQPGDDLRRLDWNAYARSDSLVVRVYREEIAPHLDVVLDSSISMAVRPTKEEATITLAGVLAGAADSGGYSHRCWRLGDDCHEVENSSGPIEQWVIKKLDGHLNSGEVFAATPPRFVHRGVRIFVSDLLFPTDPELVAAVLARDAAVSAVVQLLDSEDRDPPQNAMLRLVDSETGEIRELRIDGSVRRRYAKRLETHSNQWRAACQRRGILFASVAAEALLDGDVDSLIQGGVLECR
jgi:uncharacterized protein (DUF58 family)